MNHINHTQERDQEFLHAMGAQARDCNCPACSGEPPAGAAFVGPRWADFQVECGPCLYRGWFSDEDLQSLCESPLAPCGCLWTMVQVLRTHEPEESEPVGERFELLDDAYSY